MINDIVCRYLCSFQVNSIHEGSLEVFDSCVLSFQQTLQLQIWLSSEKRKVLATVDKVFSFRQTVMAGAIKTFSKSLTQNPNPLITVFGTEVPNFLTLWMMKTNKNYVLKYVCSYLCRKTTSTSFSSLSSCRKSLRK